MIQTIVAAIMLAGFSGCAGRTDVTAGADQAKRMPDVVYGTPRQDPQAHRASKSSPPPADHHQGDQSKQTATDVPPDPSAAQVAKGFRVEVAMKDLNYPTSAEVDEQGNLFIAEAGYAYGDPTATPRILRMARAGKIEVIASEGLTGPINDLLWHDGKLFVSHRGKISVLENETLRDLVTGLPSEGDHHNNQLTAGPDGKIYFGQGTVTNSGVVGIDNADMGWLKKHPQLHDVPAKDINLTSKTFESENPLESGPPVVATSAFQSFGQTAGEGAAVNGKVKAGGTILRMNPDGSGLEVYAWGLRNPFGVMWSPDRILYATENGMDVRGSRPVANDEEDIYVIKEGAWYGWPDYAMGVAVTDPRFKPQDKPQPEFLLADHPPVEKPWMNFPKHTAIAKLAFSTNKTFGAGRMYVAFFGHMTPMTGKEPKEHGGHRVVVIDPVSKKSSTFFGKKEHRGQGHEGGHASSTRAGTSGGKQSSVHAQGHEQSTTPGPRRPLDVVFSPKGDAMYIVDFGMMKVSKEGPKPVKRTGVVWRVLPE